MRDEDTLLHRETLFVITTRDAEDIALELVANGLPGDFLRQFLVIKYATRRLRLEGET